MGDGSRVTKDSLRIHALGEVDELNSVLGLLLVEQLPENARALLTEIQHDLFDLGGELSVPGMALLAPQRVGRLERELDAMNADLQPLKEFILPGGTRAAAVAHHARTVCRRAERSLVALSSAEQLQGTTRHFLNRLSDLLFVLARYLNLVAGCGDILWQKGRNAE